MRSFPRFTEVESERLVAVAAEAIAERCSKDAGYLRFFIRDYLGIAEAAFPPVYARCQQDPTYLTGIARDHVVGLRERAVLDLLQEAMDKQNLAERLGFDALDPRREQAYRRATNLLNRHQKVVLVAAFCVSVFMLFVPPWIEEHWRTKRDWLGGTNRVKLLESRSAGYGSWSSHQPRTDAEPEGPVLFEVFLKPGSMWGSPPQHHEGRETVHRLDFKRLAIQLLVVWGLSGVLLVVLRNKRHEYSDCLRQCGASMLPTQTGDNVESATPPDNGGIQSFPIQGFGVRPDR